MTVWHQGKHICLLKTPLEKDNAMKMVMMLKNVMGQKHNGFGQSVSLGAGRASSSRTIHQNMHEEQGNL